MKGRRLLFSSIMALGLSLGLLWLLDYASNVAHADPGTRYVTTDGVDSGNCESAANPCRTVQYAIKVAGDHDEVWVAEGTYTDTAGTVATITKTVTVLGGWNDSFAVRDPDTYTTTLDARSQGRVVEISGSVSPTIDGFTITGGNANNEAIDAGYGGGIYSLSASPLIRNNIIISNMASISPTMGRGGGISLHDAPAAAVISGNQVVSNTASTGPSGRGGGLYLEDSDATVRGNLILSNTGSLEGGGIAVWECSPHLVGNEIIANVAGRNGGGVISYHSSAVIEGNLILGNIAGWDGSIWHGGGIMFNDGSPTIIANRIFSNSAGSSGGLGLSTSDYFTVANNLIAHNGTGGIKLWEDTRYGLIANNTFAFNTSSHAAIYLAYDNITPTIVNNIVVSNSYGIEARTDAGVVDDIDGEPREGNPDIGADEFFTYVHLPLALKRY